MRKYKKDLQRFKESNRIRPKSLKKYKCKRNKGDHVFELIEPNMTPKEYRSTPYGYGNNNKAQDMANLFQRDDDSKSSWYKTKGAKIYECKKCGKIDMKFNKE